MEIHLLGTPLVSDTSDYLSLGAAFREYLAFVMY